MCAALKKVQGYAQQIEKSKRYYQEDGQKTLKLGRKSKAEVPLTKGESFPALSISCNCKRKRKCLQSILRVVLQDIKQI